MTELEELYRRHMVVSDRLKRMYIVHLNERPYDMEYTTPVFIHIAVGEEELHTNNLIMDRSWANLLVKVADYLQQMHPKSKEELINFRTDWSKTIIYSDYKNITNSKQLSNGLYLNINHTARHSCWLISDLLKFYNISPNSFLLIRRAPIIEPAEIKQQVETMMRDKFKEYLIDLRRLDESYADKYVQGIYTANKVLKKVSKSYYNFYLLDDIQTLWNYKSMVIKQYPKFVVWSDEQIEDVKKSLELFNSFFKYAMECLDCQTIR